MLQWVFTAAGDVSTGPHIGGKIAQSTYNPQFINSDISGRNPGC